MLDFLYTVCLLNFPHSNQNRKVLCFLVCQGVNFLAILKLIGILLLLLMPSNHDELYSVYVNSQFPNKSEKNKQTLHVL